MAKILWLDDIIDERKIDAAALQQKGHNYVFASTNQEAIDSLTSQYPPDLLIQDLHRPPTAIEIYGTHICNELYTSDSSGWRFYKYILRAYFPQLPVIIYTFDATKRTNYWNAKDYNLIILQKGGRSHLDLLGSEMEKMLSSQRTMLSTKESPPNIVKLDFDLVNAELTRISHTQYLENAS